MTLHHLANDQKIEGVFAKWATENGYLGANVKLVDIELGWNTTHSEYNGRVDTPQIHGNIITSAIEHGTNVLGIIMAGVNPPYDTDPIVGIAPGIFGTKIASVQVSPDGSEVGNPGIRTEYLHEIPNAIQEAIDNSSQGDVILLEQYDQALGLPAESYFDPVDVARSIHNKIKEAVEVHNRIVIEPAGQNQTSHPMRPKLDVADVTIDSAGTTIKAFDRDIFPNEDSGAIMVSACNRNIPSNILPHTRWDADGTDPNNKGSANHGNRIDCYAGGSDITTTSSLPGEEKSNIFGGTSGAAAIIAGVAIVAQGAYKQHFPTRPPLTSQQMRDLLRMDGTSSPDAIGILPNLKHMIGIIKDAIPPKVEYLNSSDLPLEKIIAANPIGGSKIIKIKVTDKYQIPGEPEIRGGFFIPESIQFTIKWTPRHGQKRQ